MPAEAVEPEGLFTISRHRLVPEHVARPESGLMTDRFPAAPWPAFLKGTSVVVTLILAGAGYLLWSPLDGHPAPVWRVLMAGLMLVIVVAAALYVVRDYQISDSTLRVRRLLWHTTIDLSKLQRATLDPQATKGSIRVFGNGGLYSFTGYYRNREIGTYRAFITDWNKSVILHLGDRAVVLSPADPTTFLQELRASSSHRGKLSKRVR